MTFHGRAASSLSRSHPANGARDAAHLRRLNLDRVFTTAMERPGPFTRGELMAATGLSAPTVGALLAELIRKGYVTDLGSGPSSGGRRPALMQFDARHGLAAAIDIGATRTRLALADVRGDVIAHHVIATPRSADAPALVDLLAEEVRRMLEEARLAPARLLTVVAGVPGPVDSSRGVALGLSPGFERWSHVPMADLLHDALGADAIVEKDVNLAVLGEHWRGAAQGHDTCAFITFGSGISAGVMVNGILHQGVHFAAGEIGQMCVSPSQAALGGCGTLESLVGTKGLETRWTQAGGSSGEGALSDLFAAARRNEPEANAIVTETAVLIALASVDLNLLIDPSLIVLGGSLIEHHPELIEQVRVIVSRFVRSPAEIVMTALDREAPLWGSLLVAAAEARARVRHELLETKKAEAAHAHQEDRH